MSVEQVKHKIEYYFGEGNLSKDQYLQDHMDASHFVSLDVIAEFPSIQSLTTDRDVLLKAIEECSLVELDEAKKNLRPVKYVPITRETRTILVLRDLLHSKYSEEDIKKIFLEKGCSPSDVRQDVNNTWFVNFDTEAAASTAFDKVRTAVVDGQPLKVRIKASTHGPVPLHHPHQPRFPPQYPPGADFMAPYYNQYFFQPEGVKRPYTPKNNYYGGRYENNYQGHQQYGFPSYPGPDGAPRGIGGDASLEGGYPVPDTSVLAAPNPPLSQPPSHFEPSNGAGHRGPSHVNTNAHPGPHDHHDVGPHEGHSGPVESQMPPPPNSHNNHRNRSNESSSHSKPRGPRNGSNNNNGGGNGRNRREGDNRGKKDYEHKAPPPPEFHAGSFPPLHSKEPMVVQVTPLPTNPLTRQMAEVVRGLPEPGRNPILNAPVNKDVVVAARPQSANPPSSSSADKPSTPAGMDASLSSGNDSKKTSGSPRTRREGDGGKGRRDRDRRSLPADQRNGTSSSHGNGPAGDRRGPSRNGARPPQVGKADSKDVPASSSSSTERPTTPPTTGAPSTTLDSPAHKATLSYADRLKKASSQTPTRPPPATTTPPVVSNGNGKTADAVPTKA